jgi:thiamine pyrophosphate-dependent acetolactate synthase large subunit-like protein
MACAAWRRRPTICNGAVETINQRRTSWNTELAATKRDERHADSSGPVARRSCEAAPRDAIYVTDVGWNKNGAGQQLYSYYPQTFITSGALATMGFAPAAAIGAKIGAPDRTVISSLVTVDFFRSAVRSPPACGVGHPPSSG